MSKMELACITGRIGIDYLKREGIEIKQAECFKHMLEQTTKWSKMKVEVLNL